MAYGNNIYQSSPNVPNFNPYPIPTNTPPEPEKVLINKSDKKPKKIMVIVVSALLIFGLITIGFFVLQNRKLKKDISNIPGPSTPTPTQGPRYYTLGDDWQTYTDTKFGFSFKYPKNWEVKKYENWKDGEKTVFVNSPNSYKNSSEEVVEGEVFSVTVHAYNQWRLNFLLNKDENVHATKINSPGYFNDATYLKRNYEVYDNCFTKILFTQNKDHIFAFELVWRENIPTSEITLDQILGSFKFQ